MNGDDFPVEIAGSNAPNELHVVQEQSLPATASSDIVTEEAPVQESLTIENDFVDRLSSIETQLADLKELFKGKITNDLISGELFQKLHGDLERYRDDFLFKHILKKLFKDLVALFDRVDGLVQHADAGQLAMQDVVQHIKSFQKEILHIMHKQGISLIESKAEKFDDRCQEAVDIAPVSDIQEDQKVRRVVRRGFLYDGQVLRPEEVVVAKYQKEGDSID